MDLGKRYRLQRELQRNTKRIEELLKEAEILEDRNCNIQKELQEG